MLDQQRPLREFSRTVGAVSDLQLGFVARHMPRVCEGVEKSFLAVWTNVGILAGVLLNLVFLQLKLATELLVALGALQRQQVDVMSLEVASHVALNREYLVAVGVRARDHWMLVVRLVCALFVSLEVELVCVLLRASRDIAFEVFLKLQK